MNNPNKSSLIRPIAATIGALFIAILSMMSGTDRIIAENGLAKAPFLGGKAAGAYSTALSRAGDRTGAIVAAEQFVRTDPIDPAATAILGSTLLTDGQDEAAQRAFRVAGQLGWRQVSVQLYWLATALALNDTNIAQQRLDALMRLDVNNEQVNSALQQLEATPEGRRALAGLLVQDPPWMPRFLADAGHLKPDELVTRERTIALARKQGADLDCGSLSRGVFYLISRKYIKEAKQLWQSGCGSDSSKFINDGDFEQSTPEEKNPFTWNFPKEAGIEASVEPAPRPLSGHALKIKSTLSVRKVGAYQILYLSPGGYRLSWQSWSQGRAPDFSIIPQVICNQSRREATDPATTISNDDLTSSLIFHVPNADCAIQTFSIVKQAAGFGQNDTGWVDKIAITPAP
ncbi:tetratricopeptide repeat protein [Stakelama marina]|uniref:Tetratricopeptide repeat protein n=1 Tax=Stakelama marina TaxID=2826939 RepID=A0A8T4IIG2_9SPHN|nr:hypothetical protein [Stakelama marina]MBR0552099.1 hypothetical protein [Stakelama marina]